MNNLSKEEIEAFEGLNQSYIEMNKKRNDSAPTCHFKKMFYDQSDSTDGYYEEWWECSVCGHTKPFNPTQ